MDNKYFILFHCILFILGDLGQSNLWTVSISFYTMLSYFILSDYGQVNRRTGSILFYSILFYFILDNFGQVNQ
jgi:hypothetical protein